MKPIDERFYSKLIVEANMFLKTELKNNFPKYQTALCCSPHPHKMYNMYVFQICYALSSHSLIKRGISPKYFFDKKSLNSLMVMFDINKIK